MNQFVKRFARDESGATAIEYGMIIALIAVAIIGVLGLIGPKLDTAFGKINTGLGT